MKERIGKLAGYTVAHKLIMGSLFKLFAEIKEHSTLFVVDFSQSMDGSLIFHRDL